LKTGFLILIGIVLICSIFFGIMIWRQTVKFEKKALQAKKQKEEYLRKLEEEQRLNQEALSANQDDQLVDNEDGNNKDDNDNNDIDK
jgi:predicted Holliday junction resolvase-like endonuclease